MKSFPNFTSIPFDYTYLFNNRPILLGPGKDLEKPPPPTRKLPLYSMICFSLENLVKYTVLKVTVNRYEVNSASDPVYDP